MRLPNGWTLKTLGDVAEVVSGSTPKTGEPSYWNGDIPWITPDDLSKHREKLVEKGERSITKAGYDSCSTRLVPAGTVLFSTRAPIGYAAIARNPVCTNQGFKNFICSPELKPEFLYWYLRASRRLAEAHASGTTFLELSGRAARGLPIPIPPLDEQAAIVKEIEKQFTRLDVASESLRRAEARLARFRLTALLAAIPGGHQFRPLGEVLLSLRNGVFVSRPAAEPPGVRIFRISAVRPMALNADEVRYAAVQPSEVAGYFVEEGDLLFTRYSGNPRFVGACARVPPLKEPTLHPDKLIRAIVDTSVADAGFLELALSVGPARREIERRLKTTAGQVGIAGGQLKSVPVPVPPLAVQKEVARAASRLTSVSDALGGELRSSQLRAVALRQAILRAAFGGQRFRDDESTPASSELHEAVAT